MQEILGTCGRLVLSADYFKREDGEKGFYYGKEWFKELSFDNKTILTILKTKGLVDNVVVENAEFELTEKAIELVSIILASIQTITSVEGLEILLDFFIKGALNPEDSRILGNYFDIYEGENSQIELLIEDGLLNFRFENEDGDELDEGYAGNEFVYRTYYLTDKGVKVVNDYLKGLGLTD